MSDETRHEDSPEIGSLLADRDRLRGWLDRLNQAGSSAPPSVRDRVRADYEGRLAEVVARLSSFTTSLEASLANLRAQLSHVGDLRLEAEEARAEAALRHGVGEYGDEEWQRMEDEAAQKIAGLSSDLDRLGQEADRLEEVLAQVAPPPPEPEPVPEPAARRAPGDDIEVDILEPEEVSLVSRPPAEGDEPLVEHPGQIVPEADRAAIRPQPVEAPRFTPKGGGIERPPLRERPVRTLRFPAPAPLAEPRAANPVDEMTFLKSVTLETQAAEDQAAESRAAARPPRAGNTAAKTLKCADCGAMNRPTEWYCERCGAELAGV